MGNKDLEDASPKLCQTTQLVQKVVQDFMAPDPFSPVRNKHTVGKFQNYVQTDVYNMAKDQLGCRQLQQQLDASDHEFSTYIFSNIFLYIGELMADPFGNYLCQKLFEVIDLQQLENVVDLVSFKIPKISMGPHGTRSVQKLIEVVSFHQELVEKIKVPLKQSAMALIKNSNGNHVVQKCLNCMGPFNNQFMYDILNENLNEIATDRHGCCVLQRGIDYADHTQAYELIDNIINQSVSLMQNAFGNYVVQYIIELKDENINQRLNSIFKPKIIELSKQKFSSNVLEKCLQLSSRKVQLQIIQEITRNCNIIPMLTDQYANYVFQKALDLAPPGIIVKAVKKIQEKKEQLQKNTIGRRIYLKLLKKHNKYS